MKYEYRSQAMEKISEADNEFSSNFESESQPVSGSSASYEGSDSHGSHPSHQNSGSESQSENASENGIDYQQDQRL